MHQKAMKWWNTDCNEWTEKTILKALFLIQISTLCKLDFSLYHVDDRLGTSINIEFETSLDI